MVMTTILKRSIQTVDERLLSDLKLEYPDAIIRVEVEQHQYKKHIDEDLFWEIIASFDWKKEDRKLIIQPAIEILSRFPVEDIHAFHELMAQKLYTLDGKKYAEHLGSNRYIDTDDHFFSVDDFLYARCAVVARGKDYYQAVLQNPDQIPKEFTFESLLSIPRKAYKAKTGLNDYNFVTNIWYETFSNADGWPGISTIKERILGL